MPPVYAPEEVARAILHCAEHATRDLIVGGAGKAMAVMSKVAPRVTDLYLERTAFQQQKKDQPSHTTSSLYTPQQDGRRRGSTERYTMERAAYTRAAMSDATRVLPVLAVGALVAGALRAMRKSA